MERANEITEELKGMGSILADMPKGMPYSVPAGYFEQLGAISLLSAYGFANRAKEPDNFSADKIMPLSVPQGYFEGLTGNIMAAVKASSPSSFGGAEGDCSGDRVSFGFAQDDKKLDETLSVSKVMPFSVPMGYFEAFPALMLVAAQSSDKTWFGVHYDGVNHDSTGQEKKKATVIPLGRERNVFREVRWAAAAIMLICIGIGGYETFFSSSNNPEIILATVPNNEIQDYLQHTYVQLDMNRIVSDNNVNNIAVDNKDIIQYLNETGWDMVE